MRFVLITIITLLAAACAGGNVTRATESDKSIVSASSGGETAKAQAARDIARREDARKAFLKNHPISSEADVLHVLQTLFGVDKRRGAVAEYVATVMGDHLMENGVVATTVGTAF